MANKFTHFLQQWLQSGESLTPLVEHLDALEALVIRVYKANAATAADEAEYGKLRPWLEENYPRWQDTLQPHWQQSLIAGRPAAADPVLRLLQAEQASAFAGDWQAMQTLPAVREALNRLILAEKQDDEE
jgi:hypothetical protein